MRQAKMTAKPTRAWLCAGAFGALLLGLVAAPAFAQATPPDAATKVAMEKRTAARSLLASSLARIASNNSDSSALLDAGRASIDLDDHRAALGFLVRAEQANPRDGAIKAALGSAMVHMENPTRALDYFGEAQLLGAPERLFLSDRALARDLLGQQDAAQRDYQLALSIVPTEELTRRYALSLGISGETDRAIQLLTPQLRAQDRGAWRLRAMILAMNGRDREASEIVNATMPPAMAQNILPYLTQMDRLNPAQQAAAAHFGRFPNGQLGPKRKPVQMAAATPPAPPPAASGKRASTSTKRLPAASVAAVPTPTPSARPLGPAYTQTATTQASRAPTPAPTANRPETGAIAQSAAPPASRNAAPGANSGTPTGEQTGGAPVLKSPFRQTIRPMLATSPDMTEVSPQTKEPTAAPTRTPTPTPTPSVVSTKPESNGAATSESSAPVGPGFSIAAIGRPGAASTPMVNSPPSDADPSPSTAAVPAAPSPAASAPFASLADIVGSIEIPPGELNRPDNAIGAETLARLMDDKRKAEAADDAKREKEAAAAKAKAEADTKAKEAAAEKKAHPARIWVQIATGANPKALAFDYSRFAKRNAALFKGKSGGTADWGQTRRLLVGPFADRKAAQSWLDDYKKAEGDGFLFNSEAGETVDPVK